MIATVPCKLFSIMSPCIEEQQLLKITGVACARCLNVFGTSQASYASSVALKGVADRVKIDAKLVVKPQWLFITLPEMLM